MANETPQVSEINAEPTKAFFIDMLTRDIPLDQAILDLVDNSVDGATASVEAPESSFDGFSVLITFNGDGFSITDNCGGFSQAEAQRYAFRFGRPPESKQTPHSIGQFGVGMKRALFKFGREFEITSATQNDKWSVKLDVTEWEKEKKWTFPFTEFPERSQLGNSNPGTHIQVRKLKDEVAQRFSSPQFENTIFRLIKSKHRQFIARGLSISMNGKHVDASDLRLQTDGSLLKPGVDLLELNTEGEEPVRIRIVAGVGASSPMEAGWYIICNGRVVLEADRTTTTGWDAFDDDTHKSLLPKYHNQFSRFRGLVFFDSVDSSRVPWNTTKTNVDIDSPAWRLAYDRMVEMMRPVIDFLNLLDSDVDEFTKKDSPLHKHVVKAKSVSPDELTQKTEFVAPLRDDIYTGPRLTRIQFSRPTSQVDSLQREHSLTSAKSVGEYAFDLLYEELEE